MLIASLVLGFVSYASPFVNGPFVDGIPDDPKELSKRYSLPDVAHAVVGGIDIWVEEGKTMDLVREPIDKAMKHVEKWLGSNPLVGKRVRVIVLKKPDA